MPVYSFDPTGTKPENKIVDELHNLTEVNSTTYEIIIPFNAPFYTSGFSIKFDDGVNGERTLVEDTDYTFVLPYVAATRSIGRAIYGGFVVKDLGTNGVLKVTYQTVGDKWVGNPTEVYANILNTSVNPRTLTWDRVTNVQDTFPPIAHDQSLDYVYDNSDLVNALNQIALSITGRPLPDKIAIGLGNVENLPLASDSEVNALGSGEKYISLRQLSNLLRGFGLGDSTVWTSSNDGPGTGLNADMVDDRHIHDILANPSKTGEVEYVVNDQRNVPTPTDLGGRAVRFDFKTEAGLGIGPSTTTYYGVITFQPWNDASGGKIHRLIFANDGEIMYQTADIGGNSWSEPENIFHSGFMGDGSGLDADAVRGKTPEDFVSRDEVTFPRPTASGWYTVAINRGDRALGDFRIISEISGSHYTIEFTAMHLFSRAAINGVKVLKTSTNIIQGVRIKTGSTYDGAALQVKFLDAGPTDFLIKFIVEGAKDATHGWELSGAPVPDSTAPTGVTNYGSFTVKTEYNFDAAMQADGAYSGEFLDYHAYVRNPTPGGNPFRIFHEGRMGYGSGLSAEKVGIKTLPNVTEWPAPSQFEDGLYFLDTYVTIGGPGYYYSGIVGMKGAGNRGFNLMFECDENGTGPRTVKVQVKDASRPSWSSFRELAWADDLVKHSATAGGINSEGRFWRYVKLPGNICIVSTTVTLSGNEDQSTSVTVTPPFVVSYNVTTMTEITNGGKGPDYTSTRSVYNNNNTYTIYARHNFWNYKTNIIFTAIYKTI